MVAASTEFVLWTSSTRERAVKIVAEHEVHTLFAAFRFREDGLLGWLK